MECPPPLGLEEIAERLGVAKGTPEKWVLRTKHGQMNPPFPEPQGVKVHGRPTWEADEIDAWHETRRPHVGESA